MEQNELEQLIKDTEAFDQMLQKRLLVRRYVALALTTILLPVFVYFAFFHVEYEVDKYDDTLIRPRFSTAIVVIVPDRYKGRDIEATDLTIVEGEFDEEVPAFANALAIYLGPEEGWYVENPLRLGVPYSYIVQKDSVTLCQYYGKDKEIVVPDSVWGKPVKNISSKCFAGVSETLKSIVLPDGVTVIEVGTFRDFACLEKIVAKNITEVGKIAFVDCVNLQEADLGGNLEVIDNQAFAGCFRLEYLAPQPELAMIEHYAFYESGITEFDFNENATVVRDAFDDTPWLENWPDDFVVIGGKLVTYKGDSVGEAIVIPDGVHTIIEGSMYGLLGENSNLEIYVPKSVTKIEEDAFYCEAQARIYLSEYVTEFGGWDNRSLKGENIPIQSTIVTTENSVAHQYAQEHDVAYELVSDTEIAWEEHQAELERQKEKERLEQIKALKRAKLPEYVENHKTDIAEGVLVDFDILIKMGMQYDKVYELCKDHDLTRYKIKKGFVICENTPMTRRLGSGDGACEVYGSVTEEIKYSFTDDNVLSNIAVIWKTGCNHDDIYARLIQLYGEPGTGWIRYLGVTEVYRWDLENGLSVFWRPEMRDYSGAGRVDNSLLLIGYTKDLSNVDAPEDNWYSSMDEYLWQPAN